MAGTKARAQNHMPRRFTSSIRSHSSTVHWSNGCQTTPSSEAALLTRMSTRPPHSSSTRRGGGLDGGEVAHVAGDAEGRAAGRHDLVRHAAGALAVQVQHGDARALGRVAQRDGAADAARARRAGDDGDALAETLVCPRLQVHVRTSTSGHAHVNR